MRETIENAEAAEPSSTVVSLDDILARIVTSCRCGYASSRAVPEQLCRVCSDAVLHAWKAEEDRVIAGSPRVRADLEVVFDELLDEIAAIHLAPGDGSAAITARRRAVDRGIARVNETRAAEIGCLDRARWRDLSELNRLSQIRLVSAHGRHWSRWGLGSARITTLALEITPELQARMRRVSGRRPVPKPTLFERLFSRK